MAKQQNNRLVNRSVDRGVALKSVVEHLRQHSPGRWRIFAGSVAMRLADDLQTLALEHSLDVRLELDPSIAAMNRTITRDGIVAATLGDVRQHADQVVLLGRARDDYPRIDHWFAGDAVVRDIPELTGETAAAWCGSTDNPDAQYQYTAVIVGPGSFAGQVAEQTIASELLVRWVLAANNRSRRVDGVTRYSGRAVIVVLGFDSQRADCFQLALQPIASRNAS